MISPTLRAVFLMLLGLPVMLAIALLAPQLWIVSAGWITGVGALIVVDTLLGAAMRHYSARVSLPPLLYVGGQDDFQIELEFAAGPLPERIDIQIETNELLGAHAPQGLRGWDGRMRAHTFSVTPLRRGRAKVVKLWSRWRGPLGLIQKRHIQPLNIDVPVTPNVRWVRDEAIRMFSRDAAFGIKTQIDRGDGSEFDALREFASGMDRRAIDWKHSARHRHLLAKEFKTERNHNIVFAFDTGRLMSEPLAGLPRLDQAITAGLLLAYVSLRNGDRTMFNGFAARPGASSGFLTGTSSFPRAQAIVAEMDYSEDEANFTLALSSLAGQLERRSLIIIFSDFVDTISAELMLENIKRLTERHLVLFATFEDAALAQMADAAPDTAEDVARAVIADTLLAERDIVFRRLQRMGVQIIETTPEKFGAELVSRYLQIKKRDML
ncbi:MAG: DUF58 domain-containing protein [Hyphomonas sp.]